MWVGPTNNLVHPNTDMWNREVIEVERADPWDAYASKKVLLTNKNTLNLRDDPDQTEPCANIDTEIEKEFHEDPVDLDPESYCLCKVCKPMPTSEESFCCQFRSYAISTLPGLC